ncbi:hypothetical protein NY95_12000 [Xanthomonas citri pv. fuscans]|nr:hypothetical protein NY95_12000 [Xanthomonas citri pv. fuscans]
MFDEIETLGSNPGVAGNLWEPRVVAFVLHGATTVANTCAELEKIILDLDEGRIELLAPFVSECRTMANEIHGLRRHAATEQTQLADYATRHTHRRAMRALDRELAVMTVLNGAATQNRTRLQRSPRPGE